MGLSNWATIISGFRQKFTISSNTDSSGISIINNLNGREVLTGQTTSTLNTGPSTPGMIQNNIASMVELAQANRIKVILCSVTPAFDYPWKPGLNPAEKIIELNTWIKQYTLQKNCIYADYWTTMADQRKGMKKELSSDGVHPILEGYNIMEPIVQQAIKEALHQ